MCDIAPYYVVVDANIWIAERLLQSSIGSAFLYALTGAKSAILLPEVVELEISRVLPDMAERAVGVIRRELTLLRQLSGHELSLDAPSALEIEGGINERWKQLSGLLIRVPFTHDQATSALHRVIRKAPPSGDNNEQFRDCCIWDVAASMAADRVVHLLSNDNAFYENRNKAGGLARALQEELTASGKAIRLHPSLKDFLDKVHTGAAAIDENAIGDAIIESIKDEARETAPESRRVPLAILDGKARRPRISGYATPKPSLVAISFEASFDLERIRVGDGPEVPDWRVVTVEGVCSYDPTTKKVSEIEIRRLMIDRTPSNMAVSTNMTGFERQY